MDQRNDTGLSETAGRNRRPWKVTLGERSPMLKPLTLSLGLVVAFGISGVAMAHGNDGCATCGLASAQASPQAPYASAQTPYLPTADCGPIESCDTCGGGKKCNLFGHLGGRLDGLHCRLKGMLHPPVTYEWVLKKKRLWGHKNQCGGCNECAGPVETVYPSSQVAPSAQYPSSQAYPSGQYTAPSSQAAPVYGASQQTTYNATGYSAPTVASTVLGAEEAPPAPNVKSAGGLLLPTPADN